MVGPNHSDVEARFSALRQRLDDGGYLESFGLDSLRLVEHLYNDLLQTTESFQKTLVEYGRYKKIAEELEEGVAPFKEDNVRLHKENSQLRMGIACALEKAEDTARDPLSRLQDLESENNDLKLLVSQFAERVKKAEADSFEKTKRIAKLQEKDLGANVFVAGDKGKNVAASLSKQSMEVEYFVPDACPQCIRLRNFVEYGKNSDRNPKAVDYMKLADSRIQALQLQIRSLKNVEAEHLSLIASLRERVKTRGTEIEKLSDLIKIRPGRDNFVNAAGVNLSQDKMDRNIAVKLKTAEIQSQVLQRRNLELEEKLKKSILQEHDEYMLGRIPIHYRNSGAVQELLEKELDKYPSHDKMNLLEKLYYLERQLSHCCKEKAVLKGLLEECRSKHGQNLDVNHDVILTPDNSEIRITHTIGTGGIGVRKKLGGFQPQDQRKSEIRKLTLRKYLAGGSTDQEKDKKLNTSKTNLKTGKRFEKTSSRLSTAEELPRKPDRIYQIEEESEEEEVSSYELDNAGIVKDNELETNGNQDLESYSEEESFDEDFEVAKALAGKQRPSGAKKTGAEDRRRLGIYSQSHRIKQKPIPKPTSKTHESRLSNQTLSTKVSHGADRLARGKKSHVDSKETVETKSRSTEIMENQYFEDDACDYYSSAEDLDSEDDFNGNKEDSDDSNVDRNENIAVALGSQSQMQRQRTSRPKNRQHVSKHAAEYKGEGKVIETEPAMSISKQSQVFDSKSHENTIVSHDRQNMTNQGKKHLSKPKSYSETNQRTYPDKQHRHRESQPPHHDIDKRLRDGKIKEQSIHVKAKEAPSAVKYKITKHKTNTVDRVNEEAVDKDDGVSGSGNTLGKRSTKHGIPLTRPAKPDHSKPEERVVVSQKQRPGRPLISKEVKPQKQLSVSKNATAEAKSRKQQVIQQQGHHNSSDEQRMQSDEEISDSDPDENADDNSSVAYYDDVSFPSSAQPLGFKDSKNDKTANWDDITHSGNQSFKNSVDQIRVGPKVPQEVEDSSVQRHNVAGPGGDSRHATPSVKAGHVLKNDVPSRKPRHDQLSMRANTSSVSGRNPDPRSMRGHKSENAMPISDSKLSESKPLRDKQSMHGANSREGISLVEEPSLLSISEFERNASEMDDNDNRRIETTNYESQGKRGDNVSLEMRGVEDQLNVFPSTMYPKRNDEIAARSTNREIKSTTSQAPNQQYTTTGYQRLDGFGANENPQGFGAHQNPQGYGVNQTPQGFGANQNPQGFGANQNPQGFGANQNPQGFGDTQGFGRVADREFNRAGGVDGITSYGESSGTSYSRREGGDFAQGRHDRRGMSDADIRDNPTFVSERGNLYKGDLVGNVNTDRHVRERYTSVRSVAVNTDAQFDLSWKSREDPHEKKALQDKISALQRKLDESHADSSQFQLKSFELQGELERTKHMYQVEKQERELALSELRRIRDQNNESTARMLMTSALGSDGSFRKGATPMEMEREIANLRAALTNLDKDKDEMRVELDKKDEKLARVSHDLSNYMDEISQLKLKLKNAELHISHTGESAKEQNREAEFLKKQLESIRRDFEKTIKERDESLKELHKLSGAHTKGQMERRSVESELEVKSKEADDLRRQVQRYIDEVRRIEELLLDKEEEMEMLIQHYRSLTAENSNLEAQRTSLEREASSIRDSVRDTVDQNITFKTQLTSQNSLVQTLEEEIQRLTQQITQLENQADSKSENEKFLEADVKASKDLLYRLEVQMDKLKLDLADCESRRKQVEAENTEFNSHIASLETRLQEETERQQQLEKLVANSREKDFQTERITLGISKERDEVTEKLTSLQQRSETLNTEVSRYRLKSIELQSELDRMRRQLENEKRERESTVLELQRVRDQLNSSSANYLLNTALGTGSSGSPSVGGGQFTDSSTRLGSTAASSFRQVLEKDMQPRSSKDQSPLATPFDLQIESPTPIAASTSRPPEDQHSQVSQSVEPSKGSNRTGDDEFEAWDSPK